MHHTKPQEFNKEPVLGTEPHHEKIDGSFFRGLAGTGIERQQPRSWQKDRRRPKIPYQLL
jgi:hypothetical protein